MSAIKQNVTFRIEPEMNLKISRLAKAKKISQGEVVRRLLEIGLEYTDHKTMVDKFDSLQMEMEKFSENVSIRFETVFQKMTACNLNVIRASMFLEEFSKLMIPEVSTFLDMKGRVQIEHTKLKNKVLGGV